jgi:hypothetical protein
MTPSRPFLLAVLFYLAPGWLSAQALYQFPGASQTAWSSFENPSASKGAGGQTNHGAKGHPAELLKPGESKVLLLVAGPGTIQRIWLTVLKQSPQMLRALRLDLYWDGETKAAVSAPLGDFFGVGLGRTAAFENALFANPEGRSFNCYVPMPFRKGARVVLTNESTEDNFLFYDINFLRRAKPEKNSLYFHAYWTDNRAQKLGEDFEILPSVLGKGRFLGCNLGVRTAAAYGRSWWGEGEVKLYLDGDTAHPSLVGTGTEDYVGSGWSLGQYAHRYQGCLLADTLRRQWAFYRFHIPDEVYFTRNCKVTIQSLGMDRTENVRALVRRGAQLLPVAVLAKGQQVNLRDLPAPPALTDPAFPNGRTVFYRLDEWSSTAYFYLDKPVNNLPALAPVEQRTHGLSATKLD